jgi:hypothetical protein
MGSVSRRRRSSRAFRRQIGGTLRLGTVLVILVGVNIYVFFYSPGSLKQVSDAAQAASTRAPGDRGLVPAPPPSAQAVESYPATAAGSASAAGAASPAAATAAAAAPVNPAALPARANRPRRHDGTLRDHEGLGAVLKREALASIDADGVLRALQPLMNFKKDLHAGQTYTLRLDANGRLEAFELRAAPGVVYTVVRGADGKLAGARNAPAVAAPKRRPAAPPR